MEREGERYLHVTRFILNPTKTEDLKIQLRGVFRDDQMSECDCENTFPLSI